MNVSPQSGPDKALPIVWFPRFHSQEMRDMNVGITGSRALAYSAASSQSQADNTAEAGKKSEKPYVFTLESDENLADDRLFQNLLQDSQVKKYVSRTDTGTYSFTYDKPVGLLDNDKISMAKALIDGQGVAPYGNSPASELAGAVTWSNHELALFKSLSGYNLFIDSRGSEMIVDDFGNPPSAANEKTVNDAYHMLSLATSAQQDGHIEGPLSADNIDTLLGMLGLSRDPETALTSDSLVNSLIKLLDEQKADAQPLTELSAMRAKAIAVTV